MTGTSSLNEDDLPVPGAERKPKEELNSLGPSDSSDSGSDLTDTTQGEAGGDRFGTGERASVEPEAAKENADVDADRVVAPEEAGLGGGLDQAEEARAGRSGFRSSGVQRP